MAAIDAQHALLLANERLDGFRAEAAANRAAPAQSRDPFGPVRSLVSSLRLALRESGSPTVRLTNYPYANS